MTSLLKLRAQDSEDVQVISAVLQDAIAPVCDMAYQAETHRFVMVTQRLKRETIGAPERICSALTVKGVIGVQTQGINLRETSRILDLLAIMVNAPTADQPSPSLSFIFAGGAKIRLEVKDWAAAVEDFGEPWPAQCNPCHDSAAS